MRRVQRITAMAIELCALIFTVSIASTQDDYPNKPIRIIVGFIPGTAADISARIIGGRMSRSLGQPVVIENRPGAGSSLAAEYVARAPKDGHTLLLVSSANVTNAAINPNLSFDILKEFVPIGLINNVGIVLVVHPSVGATSLEAFVALARSASAKLTYASVGVGTAAHLGGELFNIRTGAKLSYVPYHGSPQAVTDLVAGRVDVMFAVASTVVSQIESGGLRALATAGPHRTGSLPNVPTMAEAGMPDFEMPIWFGLAAPAGTPKNIVDKLARAAYEATASKEVVDAWKPQGIDALFLAPDEFGRYMTSELSRWGAFATAAGLRK